MAEGLDVGTFVWTLSFVVCVFFALEVLRSPRPEQSISAWILLFLFVPPLGAVLYLVLGRRKLRRRIRHKQPPLHLRGAETNEGPIGAFDAIIRNAGCPPASAGNRVKFCGTSKAAYDAVLDLIDAAKSSLWISTYILEADRVGKEIMSRLAARAAEGIQVRILVDYIGSPDARDRQFVAPLLSNGGAIAQFMKVSVLFGPKHYTNLRNHRKMLVADQQRVWSGGMNLSEHYLGDPSTPGFFHDLSFVIEGPTAALYARIFAADWAFSADEQLPLAPTPLPVASAAGPGVVQVVPGGPELSGDTIYDVILTMVHRAERRLWVVTPYFIPDVGLLRAFRLAAQRGVDVRILTDFQSDVGLIDFAGIPYLRALKAAGAQVLRFRGGMIHAKALVIDDKIAFAGTTNLDQRSLFLNFEVMSLFYDPSDAASITSWIEGFFDRCTRKLPRATPARQVAEGLVRLFAPVL